MIFRKFMTTFIVFLMVLACAVGTNCTFLVRWVSSVKKNAFPSSSLCRHFLLQINWVWVLVTMRFRYGIPGAEPKQTQDEAQTNLETACFGLYQITLSVQLRGDVSTSIQEFGKLVLKDAAPTESRIVVSKQTHGTQVSRTSRKCVRARMHEKCKHRILVYPKCSKIFDAWKTWKRFVLYLVQPK